MWIFLTVVASVFVIFFVMARADDVLPGATIIPMRELPWFVFVVALGACVVAWGIVSSFPHKEVPLGWYDVWEWVSLIGTVGGIVSGITAFGLPSWGQRISCFLLSALVALASFITIGAFI